MYGGKGKLPVFLADWNLEVVLVEMRAYPPYYVFRYLKSLITMLFGMHSFIHTV